MRDKIKKYEATMKEISFSSKRGYLFYSLSNLKPNSEQRLEIVKDILVLVEDHQRQGEDFKVIINLGTDIPAICLKGEK